MFFFPSFRSLKPLFFAVSLAALTLLCAFLSGCAKEVNYAEYVSEFRGETYVAQAEGYALTVHFSTREYPYASDGVCGTPQNIVEIYLTAPDNTADYAVFFDAEGFRGGDMSYDDVLCRFFYSESAPALSRPALDVTVRRENENEEIVLHAVSVKSGNERTMPEMIALLAEQKKDFFREKTANGKFTGEIYVRLLYEEKCYYYVEITDGQSRLCLLADAVTGKILAEREK